MKFLKCCLIVSILILLMVQVGPIPAESSADKEFNADVSWSKSNNLRISFRSEGKSSADLPLKSAEIEGELASSGERTFQFEGKLEGVVSETGENLLSSKKVLGQSLIDLLPLAESSPSLVEEALFDGWEGKYLEEVHLTRKGMEILLPYLPDNLPGLKLKTFDLSDLSWDNGELSMKFTAELTSLVDQTRGANEVQISGKLEREGRETFKEIKFTFQPGGDNWNFVAPYMPAIYGRDKTGLEEKLQDTEVEVFLDSSKIEIGKIPEGYRKKNSTYIWTAEEGEGALASMITGDSDYYVHVPETKKNQGGDSESDGNHAPLMIFVALGLVVLSIMIVWYLAGNG